MPTIKARDGPRIFYKDWGTGLPVVFSHGWPLSADAWDTQPNFVASHGYRAIAHDRRGHGCSDQPWNGNDMETYADDLADLLDALDVTSAMLVGHSTGGGDTNVECTVVRSPRPCHDARGQRARHPTSEHGRPPEFARLFS